MLSHTLPSLTESIFLNDGDKAVCFSVCKKVILFSRIVLNSWNFLTKITARISSNTMRGFSSLLTNTGVYQKRRNVHIKQCALVSNILRDNFLNRAFIKIYLKNNSKVVKMKANFPFGNIEQHR